MKHLILAGMFVLWSGSAFAQDADTKIALLEARIQNAEKRADQAESRLREVEKSAKPKTPKQVQAEIRESYAKMWRDARAAAVAGCKDAGGHGQADFADGKLTYTCRW